MTDLDNVPLNEYERAKLFYIKSGLNISEKYDFSGSRITAKEYRELASRAKIKK